MTAGLAILHEEGLGIAVRELTFKRVLDRVEADSGIRVTNASVIRRVWEHQADFQSDVLAAVAAAGDSAGERAPPSRPPRGCSAPWTCPPPMRGCGR